LRFQKLISIEEEAVNSKFDFQDVQTYATFDNNNKVIVGGSLLSKFNY